MTRVTQDDIDAANEDKLLLLARLSRLVGAVVIGAAAVGALSFLWLEIRTQQHGEGFRVGVNAAGGISFVNRIDLFSTYVGVLVQASIAAAVGAGLLLASSHLYAREGRSLHGAEVGDVIPVDETEDDDERWRP